MAIACFLMPRSLSPHHCRPWKCAGSFEQGVAARGKAASPADPPLIDLAGYRQLLAKYRGKPLVVNFWATWCEPCRDEYPMIVELAKEFKPQGVSVVGVDMDDESDMNLVRRFIASTQPPFPNYRQKPGIDLDAFYDGVNPQWKGTMPQTIFYRRDGHIVGFFLGTRRACVRTGFPRDAGARRPADARVVMALGPIVAISVST